MNYRLVADTLRDLEELPIDPNAEGQRVIDGRRDAVAVLCKLVKKQLSRGRGVVGYIDGLPGSGKTGLAERIYARAIRKDILEPREIAEIPLDHFIGTERGSPQRARLNDNPDSFAANYIRYGVARTVVGNALELMSNRRPGEIHVPQAYDRAAGGVFVPHDFEIPETTKFLIVEGTGVISNLAGLNGIPKGIVPISVFVKAGVKEALFRGTLRDILNGRGNTTFEQIYLARLREYEHLVPWARVSIRQATHVCLRYPEEDSFTTSLQKMQTEIDAGKRDVRMSVNDVLADLDPEFLRVIFPGEVDMLMEGPGQQLAN